MWPLRLSNEHKIKRTFLAVMSTGTFPVGILLRGTHFDQTTVYPLELVDVVTAAADHQSAPPAPAPRTTACTDPCSPPRRHCSSPLKPSTRYYQSHCDKSFCLCKRSSHLSQLGPYSFIYSFLHLLIWGGGWGIIQTIYYRLPQRNGLCFVLYPTEPANYWRRLVVKTSKKVIKALPSPSWAWVVDVEVTFCPLIISAMPQRTLMMAKDVPNTVTIPVPCT